MRTPRPVPTSLTSLAFRQEDLLSTAQCEAAGVGMDQRARLVRDGRWERVVRGVYDTATAGDRRRDADHRRRRAAWIGMLAYGPSAVAVGPCALALHGVAGLPLALRPEVALPASGARPRDGVRVRHFDGVDTTRYGSRQISTLPAALVQALPDLPRANAVAVLDGLLHHRRLSRAGLDDVRQALRGRRGAAAVGGLWELVDARAESPLESFARLECVDAGIAPDELQVDLRDSGGRFLGRGDLGWRRRDGRWLIAEIDGREFHELPAALLRDRHRQNALISTGRIDVLRFTAADIARRGIISTGVRAALGR